jgi:hypothetical protein
MYGKPQACVRRRRSTSSTTDGQRPKESVRGRKATHWNTVQPPFRSPSFRAVGGSPGSPAARAGSGQRRGPALVDVLAVRRGDVHKTHTGSYPLKTVRIRLIRRVSSSERPPKSRKPSGPEGIFASLGVPASSTATTSGRLSARARSAATSDHRAAYSKRYVSQSDKHLPLRDALCALRTDLPLGSAQRKGPGWRSNREPGPCRFLPP